MQNLLIFYLNSFKPQMSKEFEELEKEMIGEDPYERELREKYERTLYMSNYLENREQKKKSVLGLPMLTDFVNNQTQGQRFIDVITKNFMCVLVPFGIHQHSKTSN
jgi:hypothetical protein